MGVMIQEKHLSTIQGVQLLYVSPSVRQDRPKPAVDCEKPENKSNGSWEMLCRSPEPWRAQSQGAEQ